MNLFVKPRGVALVRTSEARKGRKNFNLFVKPSAEPNLCGLCRGGKRKKEFQEIKSTDSVGLFGK